MRRRRKFRIVLWGLVLLLLAYGLAVNGLLPFDMDLPSLSGLLSDSPRQASQELDWNLMLVNRDHPVPENYQMELTLLSNGESVDSRMYPALQEMFDAMRAEGVYPVVASGYRTEEKQQSLMDEKVQSYLAEGYTQAEAEALAEQWVAVPGTSEHQLGLAVDINQDYTLSTAQQVYDWLEENAWRFGFIYRYPPDKTGITGFNNEPWHYRYVGAEAAAEMYRRGLCMEEYIEELTKGA